MYFDLYLVTNLVNGKKYVGQTNEKIGYMKRFKNHIKEANRPTVKTRLCVFHKALCKYGEANFSIKRLLKHVPEALIDYYEILWISKLNTYWKNGMGYNMTYGGSGLHGHHHSQETCNLIGQHFKNYWQRVKKDPIEYERLCKIRSVNLKGRAIKEETKIKISLAQKEYHKIMPNNFKGKTHSDETKERISEANGIKVAMLDKNTDEVICIFKSALKATYYLIEQGKTQNESANCRILWACQGKAKSAYGYKWKFIDEV